MRRFIIGFPIVFSLVAFILALLALFAGERQGFMEEYHVVMLNTSGLGHDLISAASGDNKPTTTSSGSHGVGGFLSAVRASATAAVAAAESELAKLGNEFADKLADEIGISEFYSLHVLNACEGSFTPNATAPHPGYNVTNCTEPMNKSQMNISALLDQQLSVGPFDLDVTKLGVTQDLQNELNKIPTLLMAIGVLYIIGAALSGSSLLGSISGLFLYPRSPRLTSIANSAVAGLAALILFASSLVTTIGSQKAAGALNKYGDDIGLHASWGRKFVAISWAAFGGIFLAAAYWTREIFVARKARVAGRYGEKSYR